MPLTRPDWRSFCRTAERPLATGHRQGPQAACRAPQDRGGLTRDLNQQWSGRRGIRVNAVAPGYFRSEMTDQIPRDKLEEFITSASTLGRMGEQHELDTVVVFLASPASSYIAGVTLAVDGGMSGTPPSRRGVTVMPERADSQSRPASLAAR